MIKEEFEGKIVDISEIDIKNGYFHYTNIHNLNKIMEKGLEPRIGKNSKGIEQSKKIFFAIGDIGIIAIMDVWLKWLVLRPKSNSLYQFGAYFFTKQYFSKTIFKWVFSVWMDSKRKHKSACKQLKKILDNSVFLLLDLEENIDFSFDDDDEVKIRNMSNQNLHYAYFEEELKTSRMDYWNMHTYSDKIVDSSKISLLKIGDCFCANDILLYAVKNNREYVNQNCPFLVEYLEYLKNSGNTF